MCSESTANSAAIFVLCSLSLLYARRFLKQKYFSLSYLQPRFVCYGLPEY